MVVLPLSVSLRSAVEDEWDQQIAALESAKAARHAATLRAWDERERRERRDSIALVTRLANAEQRARVADAARADAAGFLERATRRAIVGAAADDEHAERIADAARDAERGSADHLRAREAARRVSQLVRRTKSCSFIDDAHHPRGQISRRQASESGAYWTHESRARCWAYWTTAVEALES